MASYELIATPPGTGKTYFCVDLFRQEILKAVNGLESQSYFVLPSREHADRIQNLILKKEIPGQGPAGALVAGLFNAHIVTINDLTSRLLGLSRGLYPTDALRLRLLKDILAAENWSYFEEVKTFDGFFELLLDTVKEFRSTLLDIEAFERVCQPLLKETNFRLKFKDFTILMKRYEKALHELNLKEPEEDIELLLSKKEDIPNISLLILDGFYHLTPSQIRLIEILKAKTKKIIVTLTLGDAAERPNVFNYALETRRRFLSIGFKEARGLFNKNHRTDAADLMHLEKNLFCLEPLESKNAAQNIQIIEAPYFKIELQMIAREIRKTYREEDLHFSDICVILRSLSGHESLIESVFKQYEIPFFLHERKKLIEHGTIQLLYRILRLSQEDFRREDVLFVLKSPAFSRSESRSLIHEIEMLSWSKNISRGRQNWIDFMNSEVCTPDQKGFIRKLFDVVLSVEATKGPREFERRVLVLFDEFVKQDFQSAEIKTMDAKARDTLKDSLQSNFYFHATDSKQGFDLGPVIQDLLKTIEKSLYSYKPPVKNRVQIYDAVMAMPKEYKIVFVADLSEKTFPKTILEDPLFKDSERRAMNQKGFVLEERLLRRTGERYFFYMAVTRAKAKLYLSYSLYGDDGKPLLPSFFVREASKCFSAVPIYKKGLQDLVPQADEWEKEEEVLAGLTHALFNPGKEKQKLQNIYESREKKPVFRDILSVGRWNEQGIITDPRILEIFKKRNNRFSATKLETYATCAFKYYADRILNLQVPFQETRYLEMGEILHAVLEKFYDSQKMILRDKNFWDDSERLEKLLLGLLEKELADNAYFSHEPMYRKRLFFNRMKRVLSFFAEDEKEYFDKRSFRPKYFEQAFEEYFLEDAGGAIQLEGFIDRLDVSEDEKKALIIDYKLSKRPLTIEKKFEKGLEIQLPLYGLFVQKKMGLTLAGLELRLLQDRKSEGIYIDEDRQSLGLSAKKTLYSREDMDSMLDTTEARIRSYVKRLRSADISIRSKNCDHCDYQPVCRFEKWKLVYEDTK